MGYHREKPSQELGRETVESTAYLPTSSGLFCYFCHVAQALPTLGWDPLYQSSIKKYPPKNQVDRSDGRNSSM